MSIGQVSGIQISKPVATTSNVQDTSLFRNSVRTAQTNTTVRASEGAGKVAADEGLSGGTIITSNAVAMSDKRGDGDTSDNQGRDRRQQFDAEGASFRTVYRNGQKLTFDGDSLVSRVMMNSSAESSVSQQQDRVSTFGQVPPFVDMYSSYSEFDRYGGDEGELAEIAGRQTGALMEKEDLSFDLKTKLAYSWSDAEIQNAAAESYLAFRNAGMSQRQSLALATWSLTVGNSPDAETEGLAEPISYLRSRLSDLSTEAEIFNQSVLAFLAYSAGLSTFWGLSAQETAKNMVGVFGLAEQLIPGLTANQVARLAAGLVVISNSIGLPPEVVHDRMKSFPVLNWKTVETVIEQPQLLASGRATAIVAFLNGQGSSDRAFTIRVARRMAQSNLSAEEAIHDLRAEDRSSSHREQIETSRNLTFHSP